VAGEARARDALTREEFHQAGPALDDAFTALAALTGEGREVLLRSLDAVGPVVAEDPAVGRALLGDIGDASNRRELKCAFEAALALGWDARVLDGRRLGDLAPGARHLPDEQLVPDCWGARLYSALNRAGYRRWSVLLDRHVSDIGSLVNVGPLALARVLAMCFERSLAGLAAAAGAPPLDEFTFLLDAERLCRSQPLVETLLELRSGCGPPAVRDAADRLLRRSAPWSLDCEATLSALLDAPGDDRSRRLFARLSLVREDRPTIEQLATELGIGTERVRQLRHRAEARVRAALVASPAPVPWVVSAVRRRLGAVTTQEQAQALLAGHGIGGRQNTDLVFWLAGPYQTAPGRPGWLATDGKEVVARTAGFLSCDGGVRRLADAEAELGEVGVRAEQVVAWLRACGATVVDELVVSVSGPLADVVERVLDAHGRPLAVAEIAGCVTEGGRELPITSYQAAARGRRFRRWAGDRVALADWGADPGRTGAVKRPRRSGTPSSAGVPRRHEPAPDSLPPLQDTGLANRLWLWVRVDSDVLRGCDATIPASLVEGIGLSPRCRRTFASRYGPVALANEGPQPTRGSVRAVALAAGADEGDTLLLGFSASGDVAVEVRRGPSESAPPELVGTTLAIFPDITSRGGP
jgi:hypothetical protein